MLQKMAIPPLLSEIFSEKKKPLSVSTAFPVTKKCPHHSERDGWLDDLRFYIPFQQFSVISGQLVGATERLCAMEPHLQLKRTPPQVVLEPGITRLLPLKGKVYTKLYY